ncbi:MAG TPA: cell wall hydrolase [Sphingomicrobium sp.]|nr:cell wall hydrolase [Sphingomicrobium sp.]
MVKLLGGRAASAVIGTFMLAMGSSGAQAQDLKPGLDVASAVKAVEADASAKPLGNGISVAATLTRPAVASTTAVATATGTVLQAQPAQSVTMQLPPSIAIEGRWLHSAGWPLYALVDRYSVGVPLDEEAHCMAVAVYHEARGESLEGQLAVARVIMNRTASSKYPDTWCKVVKQPWQFSFVNPRTGHMPSVDTESRSWARALGITRLAINDVVPSVTEDVLWYHATYVAPSWGRRLSFAQKIGTHIFYRA